MKKKADGPKGYLEEPDPYRSKTRDGKTILCFTCGHAASAVKRLRIIGCDACDAHFHLECLDPPLVILPHFQSKWVCPLHMDKNLPCPQISKESSIIPINTPNTPNNGNIDVIVTPQSRTKAKHVEEIIINRVKYQVPENIIVLDFWAKLGQAQVVSSRALLDSPSSPHEFQLAPNNQASTSSHVSPKNTRVAQPTNFSREDVGSRPSSSDSNTPLSSLPPPPHPSSSTISRAARSDLSCLLRAAQQVNEAQRPQPPEGLALLGNAASLQSSVTSNLRKSHKKKDKALPPRTRTRGSARLSKSASTLSEIPNTETAQRLNTPEKQLAPDFSILSATCSANSEHVDCTQPSNSTFASAKPPTKPHASEGPNPLVRKRKKLSAARAPSSTAPIHQTAAEKSANSVRASTQDIPRCDPPVQRTAAVNGISSQTPNIPLPAKPITQRPRVSTAGGVARPNNAAPKTSITDNFKQSFNSQGSKGQSIQASASSGGNLNSQNQSEESAPMVSNNIPSPSVTRPASTGIKTPPTHHAPKAKPSDQPLHVYSSQSCTFAHVSDSQQARNSSSNGKTTVPATTKTPSSQSFKPEASNVNLKTATGQLSESILPQEGTSATTTPPVRSDLGGKNTAASDTASLVCHPRKKARRNNPSAISQSTHLSKPTESHTVAPVPYTTSVSQPFPNTSSTSQPSSTSVDPSVGKGTVNRGDVPGRTTINRGQKPGKAPLNKAANALLTSPVPGLKSTLSGSATVVQPKHRDPAIHYPHLTTSSACVNIPPATSTDHQETSKRNDPSNVAVFDRCHGTVKSAQKHVAPDLLSQSAQQSARLSTDADNTSPSVLTPKTTAKRRKSVKNLSASTHLASNDQKQPAEEEQRNLLDHQTSIFSRDSTSASVDEIPLDPRLSAPPTNYGIPKASKTAAKLSSAVEGPANLNAKISIALARFANDQSKLPVSTEPGKPPPRKRMKRKSAPATGTTCSTSATPSMIRGTPAIASPSTPSLSQSSLPSAAAAFVPHPQNPPTPSPSTSIPSQPSTTRPVAAAFVPHPQNPLTLVPQHQQMSPSIGHPYTPAFVPHPQHGPVTFSRSGQQLPYVPHPQYQGAMLQSGSPSFLSGRPLSHEGSSPQIQSRRASLTVHGSSPPLLASAAPPGTTLTKESKFLVDVSRSSSVVGNHPNTTPRDSVFIPLPLTKPVKTPDPSSWK